MAATPGTGPAKSATARAVPSRSTRNAHTTSLSATSTALSPSTSETPSTASASRACSMRATPTSRRSPRWSMESTSPVPASRQLTPGLPRRARTTAWRRSTTPPRAAAILQMCPVQVARGRVELTEYPLGFRGPPLRWAAEDCNDAAHGPEGRAKWTLRRPRRHDSARPPGRCGRRGRSGGEGADDRCPGELAHRCRVVAAETPRPAARDRPDQVHCRLATENARPAEIAVFPDGQSTKKSLVSKASKTMSPLNATS